MKTRLEVVKLASGSLPKATTSRRPMRAVAAARPSFRGWLLRLALLVVPFAAQAQTYSVDWHKVSGGGTSTGSVYSVSGAIGQHDASYTMGGGNYTVTGGFWSLLAVVQTPGAPRLTITRSGGDITVSWPLSPGGFTLQQNSNAANAAGWSAYNGTVNTNNLVNSVTLTSPVGNLFFRLSKP